MKTMLITGASRGIGAATALLAAAEGYNLALNYNRGRELADNIAAKAAEKGVKALCFKADISCEDEIVGMFAQIDKTLGPLDVLVNNAGILQRQMPLEEMDAARIQQVLAVNVTGQMICAREAVKRMAMKFGGNGGSIVNISSIASLTGSPFEYVDYAASKGALDSFTIGLAKEVAKEGIRVNAVRPGLIDTGIHESGGDPGRIERLKGRIPMLRGGTAGEVARAVLWLASANSSFTTGSFIEVSGGLP